jgi:hypothetical protein
MNFGHNSFSTSAVIPLAREKYRSMSEALLRFRKGTFGVFPVAHAVRRFGNSC